ncbi:MAG: glycosyltransferase family 4 protein [Pirellulales bacterium]
MVNSPWTLQLIANEGIPTENFKVVPLASERAPVGKTKPTVESFSLSRPLRVLFLGQAIVRKGIHVLMDTARQLEGKPISFEVVGPIGVDTSGAPNNMKWHGALPRQIAHTWFDKADVFVLPTLSDGFALTQLESLAHGLPVIATPNCGEVVEPGHTGWIIPPSDSYALAKTLCAILAKPSQLSEQSANCARRLEHFSLEKLQDRLLSIFE